MRQEWGAWLATMEWDWFLTITFREPVPFHRQETVVHSAGNVLSRFFVLERLFICAEPHLSKNTHLHGLVKSGARSDIVRYQRSEIWETLHDTFGRSKVEIPRGQDAVSKYVAKYCVKGQGYYELWGASVGLSGPRPGEYGDGVAPRSGATSSGAVRMNESLN